MEKGELNTAKYVHVCVQRIEGGDYSVMLPYAEHPDAVRFLQENQLHRILNVVEAQEFEILWERFYRLARNRKIKELRAMMDKIEFNQ